MTCFRWAGWGLALFAVTSLWCVAPSAAQEEAAAAPQIAIATTRDGATGSFRLDEESPSAAYALATFSAGANGPVTLSVNARPSDLPVVVRVCETETGSGGCLAPPAASVQFTASDGEARSFGVFLRRQENIRAGRSSGQITLQFRDADGRVLGETGAGVIVMTPAPQGYTPTLDGGLILITLIALGLTVVIVIRSIQISRRDEADTPGAGKA